MRKAACLFILLLIFASMFILGPRPAAATGENWLTGWIYRKNHIINPAAGAGTNYQVNITAYYGAGADSNGGVYLTSHSRTDFGDVRFTASDGSTALDYWMETKTDSNNAVFWVEVAASLESVAQTIYVYYGKSAATYPVGNDQAEMDATFLFADHFYGSALDTNKWQGDTSQPTVSGSIMTFPASVAKSITSKTSSGLNTALRSKRQQTTTASNWNLFGLGTGSAYDTFNCLFLSTTVIRIGDADSFASPASNFASGSYKTIDLLRNSASKAQVFEDGVEKTGSPYTTAANIPTANLPVRVEQGTGSTQILVDWVVLRKYVEGITNGAWGSEEGRPTYDVAKVGSTSNTSLTVTTLFSFWYVYNGQLSGFIFQWNDTGTYQNETWAAFAATNNSWANTSKTITAQIGYWIGWRVYANDSTNAWGTLPIECFIIDGNVTLYWNTGGVLQLNGTTLTNGTIKTYSATNTGLGLSGVVQVNMLFLNFTYAYGVSTSNPLAFAVVNTTTLWCYFGPVPPPLTYIVARFTINYSAPMINEAVDFDGSPSVSSSAISTYDWDYGDGSGHGSAVTVNHGFAAAGNYTVMLTVTSSAGSNFTTLNLTVGAAGALIRTQPEDLAAAVIAAFILIPSAIIILVVIVRRRK